MSEVARRRNISAVVVRQVVHKEYAGYETWDVITDLLNHPRKKNGGGRR